MSGKNSSFATDLAGAIDTSAEPASRSPRLGMGVFAGRQNRLSDLASGSIANRVVELVDPARCRMWAGHNRDYAALSEERCHDLIESLKGQGRQEVAAVVRRVQGDPDHDFEVVSGARRHWSVSWLRRHNYPDFRFLIEVRELTEEEAFRFSDLENRARADITDYERARDYLRALDSYYGGKQQAMAERLKVSPSWMSRYLDLARLPDVVLGAFASPHDLGIKYVSMIKPLLKSSEQRARIEGAAKGIAARRTRGESVPRTAKEVIRELAAAAAPKKSGPPKKSGKAQTFDSAAGKPIVRIDKQSQAALTLTLFPKNGATRGEAEAALRAVLDQHWPV